MRRRRCSATAPRPRVTRGRPGSRRRLATKALQRRRGHLRRRFADNIDPSAGFESRAAGATRWGGATTIWEQWRFKGKRCAEHRLPAWPFKNSSGKTRPARHGGKVNCLFVDGHVEARRPEEILEKNISRSYYWPVCAPHGVCHPWIESRARLMAKSLSTLLRRRKAFLLAPADTAQTSAENQSARICIFALLGEGTISWGKLLSHRYEKFSHKFHQIVSSPLACITPAL